MKILRRFNFSWLLILLPLLVLVRSYFQVGLPFTHDGENHLARFANYKVAIREGQFPPRLAPNLMNHYGYPVFNYNYPLANILSLPFSVVGIHYELTFKLLVISALSLGTAGIWQWLKACGFERKPRLLAVAAFLLAPFTANLILVRGSIGELWALALFPWLLWLTNQIKREKSIPWLVSVPLVTAFLLSHNVSVLFGGVLWGLYALRKFGKNKQLWRRFLPPVFLAGLLSVWFWLPALAEKHWVVIDGASLSRQFAGHFVQAQQLIFSPFGFGYSYQTPVDTLSFSVGLTGLVGLVLMTLQLIKTKFAKQKQISWLWFFAISCWVLLLLQLGLSEPLWRAIPLVRFIQFPWRLTLFFTILVLPLLAEAASHKPLKKLLWLLLGIQLLGLWRFQPASINHKDALLYDLYPQSTSTLNENLPQTFKYLEFGDWTPEPRILEGEGAYEVQHWTGSSRSYRIQANTDVLIVEPTMLFAGWQTSVNDELVDYLNNDEIQGRLAYRLPAGEHQVTTRFTQQTLPRLAGNTISGLALIYFGWHLWQNKRSSSKK